MPNRPATHRPPGTTAASRQTQKHYDRQRADEPHRRLLSTQPWRRFRAYVLRAFPLCQDCSLKPANEVHHVRGLAAHPEDLCDPSQVKCLCKGCHSKRTARGE